MRRLVMTDMEFGKIRKVIDDQRRTLLTMAKVADENKSGDGESYRDLAIDMDDLLHVLDEAETF